MTLVTSTLSFGEMWSVLGQLFDSLLGIPSDSAALLRRDDLARNEEEDGRWMSRKFRVTEIALVLCAIDIHSADDLARNEENDDLARDEEDAGS